MDKQEAHETMDSIQQRLTEYATGFSYENLTPEALFAGKLRIIDIFGVLIGGFFTEGSAMARKLAATMPQHDGATVIGTRMKTTPDMAAFVNGTTARYIEMSDTYHWPGSAGGHPSDMITPIFAAAEHAGASGREFIENVVLGYEIYLRISDVFPNRDFDHTNFCCLGTAIAAARLLKLSPQQIAQCISMAVVPNNSLRQARTGHQTMWRAAATGQAGRAGVFAAMLAQVGMEGATQPFEGKAGWCDFVARKRFELKTFGGNGTPFKITDTRLKFHASSGNTIAPIIAAEKVAALCNIKNIERVLVEVNAKTMGISGAGEQNTNPRSRESADHSVPFLVAAALKDGTVTPRTLNDAGLWNPEVRALMKKIEVSTDDEFTRAAARTPVENCARVTVVTTGGERLVGECSGTKKHKSSPAEDEAAVIEKFRTLAEDVLGVQRTNAVLERLRNLEDIKDVAALPAAFVFV